MTLLHRFDSYVMSKTKLLEIYVELLSVKGVSPIFQVIRNNHMEIANVEISKTRNPEDTVGVFITIKQKEKHNHEDVLTLIGALDEVVLIEEI